MIVAGVAVLILLKNKEKTIDAFIDEYDAKKAAKEFMKEFNP